MKQVPDRKKLRREYLRIRGSKHTKALTYLISVLPSALMTFVFASNGFDNLGRIDIVGAFLFFYMAAMCAAITWALAHRARKHHLEALRMPSVSPVTPSTLPANEILVRGSEEPPVAQSGVLLRAAQGQEPPKEELLRVRQE